MSPTQGTAGRRTLRRLSSLGEPREYWPLQRKETTAFTTLIDNLALVEALFLLAAAILAYGGVMWWWAMPLGAPVSGV